MQPYWFGQEHGDGDDVCPAGKHHTSSPSPCSCPKHYVCIGNLLVLPNGRKESPLEFRWTRAQGEQVWWLRHPNLLTPSPPPLPSDPSASVYLNIYLKRLKPAQKHLLGRDNSTMEL
eukprot:gene27391-biopygen10703